MRKIVVDASVAIKWFVPEVHAEAAVRVLQNPAVLLAPDLIFAEVGNILWKKCRLQELTREDATAILSDFKHMPFSSHAHTPLLESAWQIASTYQCTVYDSLYVALAKTESCLLVTADRKLYTILSNTPLADALLWVEEA